jgi:hypothetical protein
MKMSTGLWNYMLATGSMKAALADSELRIYAGTEPTRADDSIGSATLLCTVLNAGDGVNFDTTAVARVLVKAPAESWSSNNVATNTATFFRHVLNADTGAASTSALRIQGTVGAGGADLNLDDVALVSGEPCPVAFYAVSGSAR